MFNPKLTKHNNAILLIGNTLATMINHHAIPDTGLLPNYWIEIAANLKSVIVDLPDSAQKSDLLEYLDILLSKSTN